MSLPPIIPPTDKPSHLADRLARVSVRDFMAHGSTDLELAPGVTVLVGDNNTGKSAIVEAIRAVAHNEGGRFCIRHEAPAAEVEIELTTGEVVKWRRTARDKTAYTVHCAPPFGTPPAPEDVPEFAAERGDTADIVTSEDHTQPAIVFDRTGGNVPRTVADLLRINTVNFERTSFDVHIGDQRHPVFLIDRPGGDAADFFAAATEAERLLDMQRRHQRRTSRLKRRSSAIAREIAQSHARLADYEPLDQVREDLARLDEQHRALVRECEVDLPKLEALVRAMRLTRERAHDFARRAKTLISLARPPKLHDTVALVQSIGRARVAAKQATWQARRERVLRELMEAPAAVDTVALDRLIQATYERRRAAVAGQRRTAALVQLSEPPAIKATAPLGEVLVRAREMSRRATRLSRVVKALTPLTSATPQEVEAERTRVSAMHARVTALAEGTARAVGLESACADQERAVDTHRQVLAKFIDKTERCPTCGGQMCVDHVLAMKEVRDGEA